MRPLDLRIRNFRSYAGEHVFDFRDRTLVGIVGPIGSGKSSLLDAVAFALYGRTPRIGTATKTLINQRAADATVGLRFVVEGEVWEAVRSIRIKGQSKHALYRYPSDEGDAEPVEKLLMEGEVNDRIAQLLGLDFSGFERSVLLAQGRFAEFLSARPSERDKVLKGVFGHDRVDRMKGLAKEQRDAAAVNLEKLSVRLERFDEIKTRLAEAKLARDATHVRKVRLEKSAKRVRKLIARADEAAARLEAATKRRGDLDEHSSRLPEPEATRRILDEAVAAEGRRQELAVQLDASQKLLAKAERELAEANAVGEAQQIQQAAELLAAADPQLKSVVEADRRIASSRKRVVAATDDVAAAAQAVSEAEMARDATLGRAAEGAKIVEEAEAALERGRHVDMAATLRSGLVLEDPCPVCEQPVHEIPDRTDVAHVAELEEIVDAAKRTKREVDEAHTAAIGALERSKEKLKGAESRSKNAEAQLAAAEKDALIVRADLEETTLRLEKALGPGDPAEHLETRRRAYEALMTARDEAQRSTDQIRGRHDQAIRDEQQSAKLVSDLAMRLAELATRLQLDLAIGDQPDELRQSLAAIKERWQRSTAEATQEQAAARTAMEEARTEHQDLLADLEIERDLDSAIAVATDRITRLDAEIERDGNELDQASSLYDERDSAADRVEILSRINRDLTDSRFVRFLLDEERARLAELGSEHFQQLSAGRYRFADDQFAIVDLTAADSTRRADSLSGGETFLASLGLALALAEMVAGTGGRLDAFFLDEGFGTLDPEHLDLAMEGIERLVAGDSDRLVVIVSHVPELRMRLEDLIELERNPVTGDTKVLSS